MSPAIVYCTSNQCKAFQREIQTLNKTQKNTKAKKCPASQSVFHTISLDIHSKTLSLSLFAISISLSFFLCRCCNTPSCSEFHFLPSNYIFFILIYFWFGICRSFLHYCCIHRTSWM